MSFNLSALTAQQQAAAIYIGYYDRAPDPYGMDFWEAAVRNPLVSLVEIATYFSAQEETYAVHPFFVTPSASAANAFISELYLNLFNRAPDVPGLTFWSSVLQESIDGTGPLSVGEIILAIIEGAQNSAEGQDITTLLNKIEVANAWTDAAEAAGLTAPNSYGDSEAAQASAKSIINDVTFASSSVDTAKAEITSTFENFVDGSKFTLTADTPSILEGDSGTKVLVFKATLDEAPTQAISVNYETLSSGTAASGDDFIAAAGVVTFAPGQTVATVSVTVLGDATFEADETIQLKFSGARLTADVTATGTITNDDIDPQVALGAAYTAAKATYDAAVAAAATSSAAATDAQTAADLAEAAVNSLATANAYSTAAKAAQTAAVAAQADAAAVVTAAAAVQAAAAATLSIADDADVAGVSATALAAKAAADTAKSVADAEVANAAAQIVNYSGQTYTLTTGVDSFTGTAGDDTFNSVFDNVTAANNTISPGDVINGGLGDDTLNILVNDVNAADDNISLAGVSGIENFFIRNIDAANEIDVNAGTISGEQQLWNDRSTATVDFNNVGTGAVIGIKGDGSTTNGNTEFDLATATDAISIVIDGGVTGGNITRDETGATTAVISSTGAANTVGIIDLDAATAITGLAINATTDLTAQLAADYAANTKITISGAASKVDLDAAALSTNISEVDASGLTAGGAHLEVGDGGVKITGGAGNDVVNLAGFAQTADVALGAGTGDLIEFTASTNYVTSAAKVSGAEILKVSGVGSSYDVTLLSGITDVQVDTTGGTITLTKLADAANTTVIGNITTLDLDLASTSGTNSTTVTIDDDATTAAAVTIGAITVAGVETINIVSGDTLASGTAHVVSAFTGSTAAQTVNVSGTSDVQLNNISALAANATVNASSFTKNLTVGGLDAGDTVRTGSGNDTINIAHGNLATTTVISGGAGDDTLNVTGDDSIIEDGDFAQVTGIDNLTIASTGNTTVTLEGFAQAAIGSVDANSDGRLDISATTLTTGGTINTSSLLTMGVDILVTNTVAVGLNGNAALALTGGALADTFTITQNSVADDGGDTTTTSVTGGNGIDTISYTLIPGGAGTDVLTVVSTATTLAHGEIISGFVSGTDKYDYNGALTNAVTNLAAGADLAAAIAVAGVDGVYQATTNIANLNSNTSGNAFTTLLASDATNLAANYAALEAQLTAADGVFAGAIAGLDAELTNGQTALIALDNGVGSIVLRYTADTSGTANVITADEIDLVGVFTNTAELAAIDFI